MSANEFEAMLDRRSLEDERDALRAQVASTQSQLTDMRRHAESAERQLTAVREYNDRLGASFEKLRARNAALRSIIATLSAELNEETE